MSVEALVRDLLLSIQVSPADADLTPLQWVDAFRAWVRSHEDDDPPLLSDEAISRDFIYKEREL
jgi:hypothetical protein